MRIRMKISVKFCLALLIAVCFGIGCASVPQASTDGSTPAALRLLKQSSKAHGFPVEGVMPDINVHLEGTWVAPIGSIQPKLVDEQFRGGSEERYMFDPPRVGQSHTGAGGIKHVVRKPGGVQIWYNGKESQDAEARDAAALVADSYRMFLLGPKFFQERDAVIQQLPAETVDGMKCDQLLAVLKPGLGNSAEDRVLISIDQKQHLVRRVRMTLEGLQSTKGAVVDVYLRDPVRIGGILWPTTFYERLRRPFELSVHNWRLTGIDFDRGLSEPMLGGPTFLEKALRAAGTHEQPLK